MISRLALAVTVLLNILPGTWFEYDRAAILAGQWWRMLTSHLCHFDLEQIFWNGLTVLVAVVILRRFDPRGLRLSVALSAVAIPVAMLLFVPKITHYRGISGVASALYIAAGCQLLEHNRKDPLRARVITALLFGFLGKCAWEAFTGTPLFVSDTGAGYTPVPEAHLVGGLIGLMVARRARSDGFVE